jgi:hypothetical protein
MRQSQVYEQVYGGKQTENKQPVISRVVFDAEVHAETNLRKNQRPVKSL